MGFASGLSPRTRRMHTVFSATARFTLERAVPSRSMMIFWCGFNGEPLRIVVDIALHWWLSQPTETRAGELSPLNCPAARCGKFVQELFTNCGSGRRISIVSAEIYASPRACMCDELLNRVENTVAKLLTGFAVASDDDQDSPS